MKNKYTIDNFILWGLILYVLFGKWLGGPIESVFKWSVTGCLLLRMFLLNNAITRIKINKITFTYMILGLLVLYNIMSHSGSYLLKNIVTLFSSSCIIFYLGNLLYYKRERLISFFKQSCNFITIYFFINTIISIVQLYIPYFLYISPVTNTYYYDNITGIMGESGTHRVALLSCIVLLINYNYRKFFNYKMIYYIILLVSFLMALYVSVEGHSRAWIIVMLLTFLVKHIITKSDSFYTMIRASFLPACVLLVLFLSLESILGSVENLFGGFYKAISSSILSYSIENGTISSDSDERFLLTVIALQGGLFGNGIASIDLYGDASMIDHFGMSSMQFLLYAVGIIPTLWYIYLTAIIFSRSYNSSIVTFFLIIFILFMLYYTVIYTAIANTILFAILCSLLVIMPEKQ